MGALLGGYLCDRYGRKRIYQFDMLFYAFGMAWLVFASAPWMIVLGFVLVYYLTTHDHLIYRSFYKLDRIVSAHGNREVYLEGLFHQGELVAVLGEDGFNVDLAICPEQILTDYIVKLVEFPEALQVLEFAEGRVSLIAVRAWREQGVTATLPVVAGKAQCARASVTNCCTVSTMAS